MSDDEEHLLAKDETFTNKQFIYGIDRDVALAIADRVISFSGENALAIDSFVAGIPTIIQDETCELVRKGFCVFLSAETSLEAEINKKFLVFRKTLIL